MSKKNIFSIIFWSIIALITIYLSGIPELIGLVVTFYFFFFIYYAFSIIWRLITRKPRMNFGEYLLSFAYRIGMLILVISALFGSFTVYQNEINPAYLPRYTITDGKKTIVFQTMAHIASERFYESVKNQITEAKKKGFILYYEGVQPGTPENAKKLNEAMGVVFDKSLYTNISKLYGLREQRNHEFLNIENNHDVNVDISIDEIVTKYEKRLKESGAKKQTKPPVDLSPLVNEFLKNMGPRELAILNYLNRAIMNMIMKNEAAQEAMISASGQQDIFATILGDRNEHLAKALLDSKEDKIFVIYGMLHFDGVYQLLQTKNPAWHVAKLEVEYPVKD